MDISEQNIWIYYVKKLRQIVSSENLGYSLQIYQCSDS